jgi:preprotein translocase subunit SecE
VARDRQRSKGRRKRPSRPADRPAVAPDLGLDDAAVEEAGLGELSTPGTLEGATPYADEARLAEAGAAVPEPGDEYDPEDDDLARAPDEVEGDLVPVGGGRGGGGVDPSVAEELGEPSRPRRQRGRFITFLGHCIDELRRVQWPNRRQVGQATAVVLGFVVLAGGYLGLMDAIWKPIVNAII